MLTHVIDSHHNGSILSHVKNTCASFSSEFPQNGHNVSLIATLLLLKFVFVCSLSFNNLHAKIVILVGTRIFHNSSNTHTFFISVTCLCDRIGPETEEENVYYYYYYYGASNTLDKIQMSFEVSPPSTS